MGIFNPGFDFEEAVRRTREVGYCFVPDALEEGLRSALEREAASLDMEVGDHEAYPIGQGKPNEVRQRHARAYRMLGDGEVPQGTALCRGLARLAAAGPSASELSGWMPTEIGYQRYRGLSDRISPHRDRRSDRLFSVTFTIVGSAWVHVYEPKTDPADYGHLRRIDSALTAPGTAMFLRAPGLGSGIQVIHEVMPPERGEERLILNLRMRTTLLPRPQAGRERTEG